MKLHRMKVRNFRCYCEEIEITFDDVTALIGKNDAGKSTILEALDIFLNDGTPDKDDASKKEGADPSDLTIICEFSSLQESVVIDEDNPTCLTNEYMVNASGHLEIQKTYSGNLASPKLKDVFIHALHPSADQVSDLLQLSNAKLKVRARELNADLSAVNQNVNAQLRARIREHVGDLKIIPTPIPLNDNNGKKIWASLKTYLPAFALFKSDRASSDQDPEAQDPLKAAVKEAIKAKEKELQEIAAHVEEEVRKIAQSTLEKLSEMDATLATQLNPQFTPPRWESLFKASITGDNDIPINKRGSGVRRLILLNFFRAKAEKTATEAGCSSVIYGIEEPETSQHPNNQRMLLRALMELSDETQVIISTHTPMLARSLPDTSLRYVKRNTDETREILMGGEDTNALCARALGVLPDHNVKLFIGVEGPNDIAFLQNISNALIKDGEDILNLEQLEIDGEIIFFPLGGSTLMLWSARLEALGRPEFHLYDSDHEPPREPKYKSAVDVVNARPNCCALSTVKKEMENYIHCECIEEAYSEFSIELSISENFDSFADTPVEVAKLVHAASGSDKLWDDLDENKRSEKERKAKRVLNGTAARLMTRARLDEIDKDGELLSWFTQMKTLMGA